MALDGTSEFEQRTAVIWIVSKSAKTNGMVYKFCRKKFKFRWTIEERNREDETYPHINEVEWTCKLNDGIFWSVNIGGHVMSLFVTNSFIISCLSDW